MKQTVNLTNNIPAIECKESDIGDVNMIDVSEQLGFDPNDDDNSIYIENSEYQKQRLLRKRAEVIEDYINTRLGFDMESDYKVRCILKADLNIYEDNWIDEEYEETGELHMCHNFLDITYTYELIFRNKRSYEIYVKDIVLMGDFTNEEAFTCLTRQLLSNLLPADEHILLFT